MFKRACSKLVGSSALVSMKGILNLLASSCDSFRHRERINLDGNKHRE